MSLLPTILFITGLAFCSQVTVVAPRHCEKPQQTKKCQYTRYVTDDKTVVGGTFEDSEVIGCKNDEGSGTVTSVRFECTDIAGNVIANLVYLHPTGQGNMTKTLLCSEEKDAGHIGLYLPHFDDIAGHYNVKVICWNHNQDMETVKKEVSERPGFTVHLWSDFAKEN